MSATRAICTRSNQRPGTARPVLGARAEGQQPERDEARADDTDLCQADGEQRPVARAERRETGPAERRGDREVGREHRPEQHGRAEGRPGDPEQPAPGGRLHEGLGVHRRRAEVELRPRARSARMPSASRQAMLHRLGRPAAPAARRRAPPGGAAARARRWRRAGASRLRAASRGARRPGCCAARGRARRRCCARRDAAASWLASRVRVAPPTPSGRSHREAHALAGPGPPLEVGAAGRRGRPGSAECPRARGARWGSRRGARSRSTARPAGAVSTRLSRVASTEVEAAPRRRPARGRRAPCPRAPPRPASSRTRPRGAAPRRRGRRPAARGAPRWVLDAPGEPEAERALDAQERRERRQPRAPRPRARSRLRARAGARLRRCRRAAGPRGSSPRAAPRRGAAGAAAGARRRRRAAAARRARRGAAPAATRSQRVPSSPRRSARVGAPSVAHLRRKPARGAARGAAPRCPPRPRRRGRGAARSPRASSAEARDHGALGRAGRRPR